MITEVLPDSENHLWVTVGDETLHLRLRPLQGADSMLPLNIPRVFNRVKIVDQGLALRWPGGFTLPLTVLTSRRSPQWLTHLSTVPTTERFRPLLPLLRHATPGAALRTQPTRVQIMRMFGLPEGQLGLVLMAFPIPEPLMLHRLHDIGLFLEHHLSPALHVGLLRRPWAYAAYRHPHEHHLHTMMACLTFGRLDLIEAPLWALARAEAAR